MELDPGIMELIKAYMQAANMGMASPSNNAATSNAAPDMATNQGVSSQPSDPSFLTKLKNVATNPQFMTGMGMILSGIGKHGIRNSETYMKQLALRQQMQQQALQNKQQQQQQSFQNAIEIAKFGETRRSRQATEAATEENRKLTQANADRLYELQVKSEQRQSYNQAMDDLQDRLEHFDPVSTETPVAVEGAAREAAKRAGLDTKETEKLVKQSFSAMRAIKSRNENNQSMEERAMDAWFKLPGNEDKTPYDWWRHKQQEQIELRKDQDEEAMINRAGEILARSDPDELVSFRQITSWRGNQRLKLFDAAQRAANRMGIKFSVAETDRKIKMMDWAFNGKGADQIQSYNTFLQHAANLKQKLKAAALTDARVFNYSINQLRAGMVEHPEYERVLTAVEPVRKEYMSFLIGNRALYAEDREEGRQIIDPNKPLKTMYAGLDEAAHIATARGSEVNNRYKNVIGRDIPNLVSPQAQEALSILSTQPQELKIDWNNIRKQLKEGK